MVKPDALVLVPAGMTRDCLDPWSYVEIRTNGDVAPCCFRPTLGNVQKQSISGILQGQRARRLRSELLTGALDSYCRTCRAKPLVPIAALRAEVAKRRELIALPPGFEPAEYLAANPDVAKAGLDPAQHFLKYGRLEGRRLRRPLPEDSGATDRSDSRNSAESVKLG